MKAVLSVLTLLSENALTNHCEVLSATDRGQLICDLQNLLGISQAQLDAQILRILLERARPLLISQKTWSQSISSSDPVRSAIVRHIEKSLGIPNEEIEEKAVSALEAIALNFKEERKSVKVTYDLLDECGFRCACCGFLFRDQDLEDLNIELPDVQKTLVAAYQRVDDLHPIARKQHFAKPRADHAWPISLYGTNQDLNIQVLCEACNSGKANYMSYAHAAPNVGVFLAKYFSGRYVEPAVFYSVIARDKNCLRCGIAPAERPLTVRKRLEDGVFIPDNLYTVCYGCVSKGFG